MDSVLEELISPSILAQSSKIKVDFQKLVRQEYGGALTTAGYFVNYKNAFTISISAQY